MEDSLKAIDDKLTALIALQVRQIAGSGLDGIESILRSAGLSTTSIGQILGKSQRAVQLALQSQGYKG